MTFQSKQPFINILPWASSSAGRKCCRLWGRRRSSSGWPSPALQDTRGAAESSPGRDSPSNAVEVGWLQAEGGGRRSLEVGWLQAEGRGRRSLEVGWLQAEGRGRRTSEAGRRTSFRNLTNDWLDLSYLVKSVLLTLLTRWLSIFDSGNTVRPKQLW